MRYIYRIILILGFIVTSLANAEPYKGKSVPPDEVIAKNLNSVLKKEIYESSFVARGANPLRENDYSLSEPDIIGKENKKNDSYRIFYLAIYVIKKTGKVKTIYGSSNIFKLDTDLWIIEDSRGWEIIQK